MSGQQGLKRSWRVLASPLHGQKFTPTMRRNRKLLSPSLHGRHPTQRRFPRNQFLPLSVKRISKKVGGGTFPSIICRIEKQNYHGQTLNVAFTSSRYGGRNYYWRLCHRGNATGTEGSCLTADMLVPAKNLQLHNRLTIVEDNPSLVSILNRLQETTGLPLSVGQGLEEYDPVFGVVNWQDMPAWVIMETIANTQLKGGYWERYGDGYCLLQNRSLIRPSKVAASSIGFIVTATLTNFLAWTAPILGFITIILTIYHRRCRQQTSCQDGKDR